ncbi:MAG: ARMT1-like domain-containing protein [Methanoregulaceae archaeon]|nr:ARMT1-like domain-containing protein [Methanoregulaceae archaeon]
MKMDPRCTDCLISRVALECRLCGADQDLTDRTIESCAELLKRISTEPLPHPVTASMVHRLAYSILGNPDPFRSLKEESTRQATEVCRRFRPMLVHFRDYVLASVIGNTFDYGVKTHEVASDFSVKFHSSFSKGFAIDDTDRILGLTDRVVYLTDNCGEIVFDRLLLQYLRRRGSHITLVVRDAPILNDATLEEARALGLERFVDTIGTTGLGCEIGVRLEALPRPISDAMQSCTLIISKGMANYESLSEYTNLPPVAYLMAAKCPPIAEEVGVPLGSLVAVLRE